MGPAHAASVRTEWLLPLLVLGAGVQGYPGKAPWKDTVDVFSDGEPVPGLPFPQYAYGFQIPVLVNTQSPTDPTAKPGALLAFAQAYVVERRTAADGTVAEARRVGASTADGNDGWIDIVLRRSVDGGSRWDPHLTVVYRNSSLTAGEFHACQQPTPVVDHQVGKVLLMSSLDNWHVRLQESTDDGVSWTAWGETRNLDDTLRRPGWGLVFTGLPGGIQLQAPSPHTGRLVLCSSAYWSGGQMTNGTIVKQGDFLSRYSYSILSDDHGATWRIGSGGKIQPRHTTECSVAQAFDGAGDVYIYSRIWTKACPGCSGYGRGIARSTDGGETWDNATLRGLPDTTPDVEGSIASALVTANASATGPLVNTTCYYVSSPDSARRANLTMQISCGAIDAWRPAVVVDPGSSSYSSVGVRHIGTGFPKVFDLWAWSNSSTIAPNNCIFGKHGLVPHTPSQPGSPFSCVGGIRFAEVGFPPCGKSFCPIPSAPKAPSASRTPPTGTTTSTRATATTKQGTVTGRLVGGVAVFRGVPYAQPPVGKLRLRPSADPLPYPSGRWNASTFAPTCLQDHGWPSEQGVNASSEDCLYLNLYYTVTPNASVRRPVMVYFPAGEFLMGSSNDLENNWLFSEHVILVTVNYRLGWLGFSALDELRHLSPVNSTGNMGMQDQRTALRWLRHNVAAFGGDPNRITIFGESSGGSSVGYHLANPRSWGLFHRAIGESPGLTQVRTLADAIDNTDYFLALLAHNQSVGCEQDSSGKWQQFQNMKLSSPPTAFLHDCNVKTATAQCDGDRGCFGVQVTTASNGVTNCTLHAVGVPAYGGTRYPNSSVLIKPAVKSAGAAEKCLMEADAYSVMRAGFGTRSGPHSSDLVTDLWAPVVDNVELKQSMLLELESGSLPPGVPILLGANKDEASSWMHDLPPTDLLTCRNTTADELAVWATATFGPVIGPQLPPLYSRPDCPLPTCFGKVPTTDPNFVAASRMLRDYTIICPIQRALTEAKASAFLYYFAVTPTFSVNCANSTLPGLGAFHGAEVPFVFNDQFELQTPGERALSTRMGCYWSNFAASGDPNEGPGCGNISLPGWPTWIRGGGKALVLNVTDSYDRALVSVADGLALERCALLAKAPRTQI